MAIDFTMSSWREEMRDLSALHARIASTIKQDPLAGPAVMSRNSIKLVERLNRLLNSVLGANPYCVTLLMLKDDDKMAELFCILQERYDRAIKDARNSVRPKGIRIAELTEEEKQRLVQRSAKEKVVDLSRHNAMENPEDRAVAPIDPPGPLARLVRDGDDRKRLTLYLPGNVKIDLLAPGKRKPAASGELLWKLAEKETWKDDKKIPIKALSGKKSPDSIYNQLKDLRRLLSSDYDTYLPPPTKRGDIGLKAKIQTESPGK